MIVYSDGASLLSLFKNVDPLIVSLNVVVTICSFILDLSTDGDFIVMLFFTAVAIHKT